MKKQRIKIYYIIKNIINQWDPMGLYEGEFPCSSNEYEPEITKISSLFVKEISNELLTNKIQEIFNEMFGENNNKASDIMECKIIANEILKNITDFKN